MKTILDTLLFGFIFICVLFYLDSVLENIFLVFTITTGVVCFIYYRYLLSFDL